MALLNHDTQKNDTLEKVTL
jgi:hypothetical protein